MSVVEVRDCKTAAEVMANVKRTKAYFSAFEPTNIALQQRLQEVYQHYLALQKENAALKDRLKEYETNSTKLTIGKIQLGVCQHFCLDLIDLRSHRRTVSLILPRQIAMYLCRKLTLHSMPEIARMFGNRDHTTILHAFRKIELNRGLSQSLDETIKTIIASLPANPHEPAKEAA